MSEKILNGERIAELWAAVKDYAGSPARALTLAEYNALSEEEKNADIEYLITDDNDTAGDSGGSCPNVYSTEETVIGRWIDGRPVYRVVLQTILPMSGNVIDFDTSNKHLLSVIGWFDGPDGQRPVNVLLSTGYFVTIYADVGKLNATISYEGYRNKPVVLILEYTKTTDQAKGAG